MPEATWASKGQSFVSSNVPSALQPSWESIGWGTHPAPSWATLQVLGLLCLDLHVKSSAPAHLWPKPLSFAVHELTPILVFVRQHKVLCQGVATRQVLPCSLRNDYHSWFSAGWTEATGMVGRHDTKSFPGHGPGPEPEPCTLYPPPGHTMLQPFLLVAGLGSGRIARLLHHLFPEERVLSETWGSALGKAVPPQALKKGLCSCSAIFSHLG